ncbi:MAG: chromosome segregation SMC family protein [Kouleothrix sp.]
MYLKRLEIQGFKTFAARTVFEFRPGITAVVGPNGSGKSNIADAVRWVLGEQSYATLRSKRTEDLLFSGGGRRAPAGLAEVSLTIDNSDRLLPLPYGEVTLTRRATRAGDNEYFINRSRVRLRDLQEAVGPLGGSYTIINQGLVDSALTLRPEERRRLFEDAAEISVFESRKHDAERKLRETEANLERCEDVLAELEPRLRSLKRQAGLARSYRELAAELRLLLVQHYVDQWHAAQSSLAQSTAAEQQLTDALHARRAEQAAATLGLRTAREQLRALRDRLAALHAESSALHARAEAIQRDLAVGNERQAALIRRGEEFERSLNEFDLRREELDRERTAVAERLAAAEANLAEQRAAVTAAEHALAAREHERRTAQRAIEAAQRTELAAAAALHERHRRAEQLAAQHQRLLDAQSGAANALATATQALAERLAAAEQAQARRAAAEQARQATAQAAEQARHTLDRLRAERTRADEALAHARRAVADTEARLATLTRLQRSYAGTFAGVRAAMQWAEAQRRAGFMLVSALIRTPAHLETAVEVALGSRLQNIVVERWADAEDAIEALRHGGQGRATFLPLDTIRRPGPDERRPGADADGVLGIATDLVEFDQHYRPVIQYLLGRTLVVADLPTARRELKRLSGGWALVTLAGEQVSSGGAVTGGAQVKRPARCAASASCASCLHWPSASAPPPTRPSRPAPSSMARWPPPSASCAGRGCPPARRPRSRTHYARRSTIRAAPPTRPSPSAIYSAAATSSRLPRWPSWPSSTRPSRPSRPSSPSARPRPTLSSSSYAPRIMAARQPSTSYRRAPPACARSPPPPRARPAPSRPCSSRTRRTARAWPSNVPPAYAGSMSWWPSAARSTRSCTLQSHAALLAQIDALRLHIGPSEAEQARLEAEQARLERHEAEPTSTLLAAESAHSRAAVELQRARDRLDAIWERAAADDIDIEAQTPDPAPAAVPAPEPGSAGSPGCRRPRRRDARAAHQNAQGAHPAPRRGQPARARRVRAGVAAPYLPD